MSASTSSTEKTLFALPFFGYTSPLFYKTQVAYPISISDSTYPKMQIFRRNRFQIQQPILYLSQPFVNVFRNCFVHVQHHLDFMYSFLNTVYRHVFSHVAQIDFASCIGVQNSIHYKNLRFDKRLRC